MTLRGRRILYSVAVLLLALAAGVFIVIEQARVSPDAIRTSVTRTEDLITRAWSLPVAATFNHQVMWQSNPSMCGPASVANIQRSMTASRVIRKQRAERLGALLVRLLLDGVDVG